MGVHFCHLGTVPFRNLLVFAYKRGKNDSGAIQVPSWRSPGKYQSWRSLLFASKFVYVFCNIHLKLFILNLGVRFQNLGEMMVLGRYDAAISPSFVEGLTLEGPIGHTGMLALYTILHYAGNLLKT
jgi:hypothetical protein